MRYLYIDNFRGFKDTLVPIEQVNFLVGENSTGKTSILSLINLLGEFGFWIAQDFNAGAVRFGGFKDIISADSKNKQSFTIGLIEYIETSASGVSVKVEYETETHKKNGKVDSFGQSEEENDDHDDDEDGITACLLKFVQEDGLPIVQQYNLLSSSRQVEVIFSKKQLKYRFRPENNLGKNEVMKTFHDWLKTDYKKERGFTVVKSADIPFPRKQTLLHTVGLIEALEKDAPPDPFAFRVAMPHFLRNMVWLAPIRSKPKRTYDGYKAEFTSEGDHTPYVIRRALAKKSYAEKKFLPFLEAFGKDSGLFDSINIKNFGRDASAPFELNVVLGKTFLRVNSVGYGVSQSLPVIIEIFQRPQGSWFAIQQPEVHLHPKAQAALGDVLFQLAVTENKRFLVETHSDYVIDRFRLNYRSNGERNLASQILFFERTDTGNKVTPIEILETGDYSESQPKTFREFFILEDMKLLGL